jgi:hypothetical protein
MWVGSDSWLRKQNSMPSPFEAADLLRPFDRTLRFDPVVCLEVAGHLPFPWSENLIESLALYGDIILFSAAPPGQGGTCI